MSGRSWGRWLGLGLAVSAAWVARAQDAPPASPATAAGPSVATVAGVGIPRAEFEQRASSTLSDYRARSGSNVPADIVPYVRRQTLETMIRFEILTLEAQRRGVTASDAEAEEQLKLDPFFNPDGKFDPRRFELARSSGSPAFRDARARIRRRLAALKLAQRIERENSPPDSALRAIAERALRRFSFDYLSLRLQDFGGDYPEPRESDVLRAYREHAADYRRPDRATLTVVFFDRPSPPDSLAGRTSAQKAWDSRMKLAADSAIAAIRSGGSFDTLAARLGSHRNVIVTRDNFPAYWQGDAATAAAVFSTRPGAVLPMAVPGRPGYLVARVEQITPSYIAPLAEASREVRARLRADARNERDDRELRPLYQQLGDSLVGPAVRLRYAVADTNDLDPGEPSEADVDRYYRGHLADYSSFDEASGAIRTRPLADVHEELRLRWRRDRRVEQARVLTEGLERAWSAGRRDGTLERQVRVRDVGPIPVGAPIDTGSVGAALAAALGEGGASRSVGAVVFQRGGVVYQILERLPRWKPTYDQAYPLLLGLRAQRRGAVDEAGARALFERQPDLFAANDVINFSRLVVAPPDPRDVPLTRADVEAYHRKHFDRYSASEMVEARHILISPTGPGPEADRIARARADSIRRRIVAGEDFATLARRTSDDPATRDRGGDLGQFGRGVMLDEFERAAFAMQAGDVSEPVHSQVGWHVIKCVNHIPTYAQPLEWIYSNVGYDAALERADAIAARRADSLFRHVHTVAEARAAAKQLHLEIMPATHRIGETLVMPEVAPLLKQLEKLKPGELYPGVVLVKGLGYTLAWPDSTTRGTAPTWESVRADAIELYRRTAGDRAASAKCAELDSMLAQGWSFDSLGTLWGGLTLAGDVSPISGISGLSGSRAALDSLALGARGGRPLRAGERSGWQVLPGGFAMFRLLDSPPPNPAALAARMQNDRRIEVDRRLRAYFDGLKQRYPVKIRDASLAAQPLPPLPPSPFQ